MNDIFTDDNDEVLTIISRSIGRTCCVENHIERAKDIVRSLRENDLSLPQPTNVPAPEPVITDDRVERAAKGIVSLRAITQWDDMTDNMKDLYLEEARAALVAALGGK